MGRSAKNVIPFNELAVKRAIREADSEQAREWRIATVKRLVMIVYPTGSAAFFVFYSNRHGKRRKLRLGEYNPDRFTLSEARTLALEHLAAVERGEDPAGELELRAKAITFQALAERCLKENRDLAETTRQNYRYWLKLYVYPEIGAMPAQEVTSEDIVKICRSIAESGHVVQADRVRTAVGGVYRWGLKQALVKSSPARGIARRAPAVARTRTPTDNELALVWDAIENRAARLSPSVRLIIQLAITTGQRRTEVAGARLSELRGLDGEAAVWVIPGDTNNRGKIAKGRTKNRREQRVPLSRQAAELFRKAVVLAAENEHADGEHLFPADMSKVRKDGRTPRTAHINGESVSKAMRRIRAVVGIDDINIHDMRRGISNWLKNQGVSREVRDLVLNHLDPSVTERHYSQEARMENQVRGALQAWADHVWKVTGQSKPVDNVVQLRA